MKIKTDFRTIPERFSKNAHKDDVILGNPVRSFPFSMEDLPVGTKFIAFTLIDYDAVPVCSFPWIHWLVADMEVSGDSVFIPENISVEQREKLVQGKNSFSTPFLENDFSENETLYVGPTPPDKDHRFTLTAYALSDKVNLSNGFHLDELLFALNNVLLEKAEFI